MYCIYSSFSSMDLVFKIAAINKETTTVTLSVHEGQGLIIMLHYFSQTILYTLHKYLSTAGVLL